MAERERKPKRDFDQLTDAEKIKRLSSDIAKLKGRYDNAIEHRKEAMRRFDEITKKIPALIGEKKAALKALVADM